MYTFFNFSVSFVFSDHNCLHKITPTEVLLFLTFYPLLLWKHSTKLCPESNGFILDKKMNIFARVLSLDNAILHFLTFFSESCLLLKG